MRSYEKNYDPQKAARVWQRVQGGQQEEGANYGFIQELIAEEWAAAATYLQLARQISGREAAVLQELYRQEQAHISCLKGIFTLITGQKPVFQPQPAVKEPPETALRRSYAREMRSLKEYEARTADPEYGHIFAKLAEQERDHCRKVLEIIGRLEQKK